MSASSRVAFATGVAGLVGAALLLSGRIDGSAGLAVLLAWGARAASAGALVEAGPVLAAGAGRSLARQASLAPAWALVLAAGVLRAGSSGLADARGANAVAGLALARGPALTVAGAWLAFAGGVLALVYRAAIGVETASEPGAAGRIVPPATLRRLEAGGVLAQAAFLVTLFLGPQTTRAADALWWVAGIGGLGAAAWLGRRVEVRYAGGLAAGLAGAGVALVLAGGAP